MTTRESVCLRRNNSVERFLPSHYTSCFVNCLFRTQDHDYRELTTKEGFSTVDTYTAERLPVDFTMTPTLYYLFFVLVIYYQSPITVTDLIVTR